MRIERAELPGVGACYTLHTHDGQLLGVIRHRGGDRELVMYTPGDPDNVERSLVLNEAEAQEVAQLLHSVVTIDHITDLNPHAEGVTVAALPVIAASRYGGARLGELAEHCDAILIAAIRDGHAMTSLGPDHVLAHGDTLIAAGTGHSIQALSRLLTEEQP